MTNKNIPNPMKDFLEGPEIKPRADETAKAMSGSGFDNKGPVVQTSDKSTPTDPKFKPVPANSISSLLGILAAMIGAGLIIYGVTQLGVFGSVRRCIGSVLDKAPSCSDCEATYRKTLFNEKNPRTCRGVQSAGGQRCVLQCK